MIANERAASVARHVEKEAIDTLEDLEDIIGKDAILRLILERYDSTLDIKGNLSMERFPAAIPRRLIWAC